MNYNIPRSYKKTIIKPYKVEKVSFEEFVGDEQDLYMKEFRIKVKKQNDSKVVKIEREKSSEKKTPIIALKCYLCDQNVHTYQRTKLLKCNHRVHDQCYTK